MAFECLTSCDARNIIVTTSVGTFTGEGNDFREGQTVVTFTPTTNVTRTNASGGGVAITGSDWVDFEFEISNLMCTDRTAGALDLWKPTECGTAIFDSGCCMSAITLFGVTLNVTPASFVTGGDAPTYTISGTGRWLSAAGAA